MQPFKIRDGKKRKGKKKEWERRALSYFSASTWQNWMRRRPPPNSLLQGRSQSVISCRVDWAHYYSFFSLSWQYSKTSHSSTDHRRDTLAPPPQPLHLSPMVLSFQLTKHLTRQSRRMHTGTGHEPDKGRGENKNKRIEKKKRDSKSTHHELCKERF